MDVRHIVKLANLSLTPEQLTQLGTTLGSSPGTCESYSDLGYPKHGTYITSHRSDQCDPLDEISFERLLTQKQALSNSPNTRDGYFEVNAIFHGE